MANNIDMAQAIKAINPSAEFRYEDNNYETIQWLNGTNPISISDIQAKQAELQTAYDAEEWKRNRQAEYPNHNDCIHALLDGGDTLTNLQVKRTAVKDKYPKE